MTRAVLTAVLLVGCAAVPVAGSDQLPDQQAAPPGRLVALDAGQPAPAELVCMPPALADWLWGAQERATTYRAVLAKQPRCDAPWAALGLGFAAGVAAGAGGCAAVK